MATVGEILRSAREQRGLNIEQVSNDTRISARFLEALEADRYDALPAPVYVRGFIRSYASYLKLDGTALLSQLDSTGAAVGGVVTAASVAREPRPAADPFRRSAPPPRPEPPPEPADDFDDEEDIDFASRQTVRSRPVPPPVVPPAAYSDVDEDGFRRGSPVLMQDDERRGPSRYLALAGIALVGVIIAVLTGVLLTQGDGGDIATTVAGDSSPTPGAGTVVVVQGSQTPGTSTTPLAASTAAQPGGPSGGSVTPTASGTPTTAPAPGEPTPTPGSGESPSPTSETATATATPTATPALPTPTPTEVLPPTPTPIPTFTPTQIPVLPHPIGAEECFRNGGDCGPSPLRVICPPDGWFIDVPTIDGIFPNPGWNETTVTLISQASGACG